MYDTFLNVLVLKVALFVSIVHIIYTSIVCGYLLSYFIIYAPKEVLATLSQLKQKITTKKLNTYK